MRRGILQLPDLGALTSRNRTEVFVEVKLALQFGADRKTEDKTKQPYSPSCWSIFFSLSTRQVFTYFPWGVCLGGHHGRCCIGSRRGCEELQSEEEPANLMYQHGRGIGMGKSEHAIKTRVLGLNA